MQICVVGLGNIGFNLLCYLLTKFPGLVSGVDIDKARVSQLKHQGYPVTDDYGELAEIDVWLMTPSTGKQGENLLAALQEMQLRSGCLISVESTLPPGTMEKVRLHLEDRGFGLGRDLFLIHVPHRVLFGVDQTVCDTPRVIGAFTQECLKRGLDFYGGLVPELVPVSDVRTAELSKVVENVKRYVDVAFAQEIYRYCHQAGIDFRELRLAVNSKDNVQLLSSDWGIGGECLPKDMGFLRSIFPSPLLEGAERSDKVYRDQIAAQIGSGKRVLVKGLSFKPGVKDLRHSPALEMVRTLEQNGNIVWVEDPLFDPAELETLGFRVWKRGAARKEAWGSDEGFVLANVSDSGKERPEYLLRREQALAPQALTAE